jgi:hypothetical protein
MELTLDEVFNVSMTRRRKLLDMSKTKILSYADYTKYIERVPEIKMVPEEVDLEELNKNWEDFSFVPSTKERLSLMNSRLVSPLGDPIPPSMQGVPIEELWAMDIHWKMLTDLRPVNKYEADLFNRLIDMGKYFLSNAHTKNACMFCVQENLGESRRPKKPKHWHLLSG